MIIKDDMTTATATYFNNTRGVQRYMAVWNKKLENHVFVDLTKKQAQDFIQGGNFPTYHEDSKQLAFSVDFCTY